MIAYLQTISKRQRKMDIIKSYILLSIFLLVSDIHAQKTWTLQECIDYAINHNIQIKHEHNSVRIAAQEFWTAKKSGLPIVSGNVRQDFSFGRGLSADNTYASTDVRTSTFLLSAEFPIFTGFRISNTVKQKKHLYDASLMELQKEEDALRIEIIRAYQEVLFKQEQIRISQKQFETDSIQTERIKILVQKGKSSKINLARQRSATSQSSAKYIQDNNAYKVALLNLSQMLELPSPETLNLNAEDINIADVQISDPDEIFRTAVAYNPEVRSAEIRLKAYEDQIKISRSGFYPTLSLVSGIGSNYYNISNSYNSSFAFQFRNNLCEYITLNLSIPIFDRLETRSNVRKSIIQRDDQILNVEEQKKNLYKAVQQAYYAAMDAKSRYVAYKESMMTSEESLTLVIVKYENGLADITEYNEELRAYSEAKSKMIQSKYEFIFAKEILNYYKGY